MRATFHNVFPGLKPTVFESIRDLNMEMKVAVEGFINGEEAYNVMAESPAAANIRDSIHRAFKMGPYEEPAN